jgi:hypothetical protein
MSAKIRARGLSLQFSPAGICHGRGTSAAEPVQLNSLNRSAEALRHPKARHPKTQEREFSEGYVFIFVYRYAVRQRRGAYC